MLKLLRFPGPVKVLDLSPREVDMIPEVGVVVVVVVGEGVRGAAALAGVEEAEVVEVEVEVVTAGEVVGMGVMAAEVVGVTAAVAGAVLVVEETANSPEAAEAVVLVVAVVVVLAVAVAVVLAVAVVAVLVVAAVAVVEAVHLGAVGEAVVVAEGRRLATGGYRLKTMFFFRGNVAVNRFPRYDFPTGGGGL